MTKSTANTDDDLLRPEFETILKPGQKQTNTYTGQQPNIVTAQQPNVYATQQSNPYGAYQADSHSVAQINKPPEKGTQEGIYERLNFTSSAPKAPTRPTNPFAEDIQKPPPPNPSSPPPINPPFSLGTASTAHEQRTEQNWAKPESRHCKYF